ncbi:hypothetical protein PINS_up022053 [Pythium insidiosum]|nr:hypothetical protein PINS_up022053 [Pythium insidiosum]
MRSPSRASSSSAHARTPSPSAASPPLPRDEETLYRCEAWLPEVKCGNGGLFSLFTGRRPKEPTAVPLTLFSALVGVSLDKDTAARSARSLLLRLGDRAPVVVVSPPETRPTASSENGPSVYPPLKTTMTLDVKSEDDVRRSLRYGVATTSAPLDVLVDTRDASALYEAIRRFFFTIVVMPLSSIANDTVTPSASQPSPVTLATQPPSPARVSTDSATALERSLPVAPTDAIDLSNAPQATMTDSQAPDTAASSPDALMRRLQALRNEAPGPPRSPVFLFASDAIGN